MNVFLHNMKPLKMKISHMYSSVASLHKKLELVIPLQASLKDEESKQFYRQLHRNLKLLSRDWNQREKCQKNLHILLACVYLMHFQIFSYNLDLHIQKSNKIWRLQFVLKNEIKKLNLWWQLFCNSHEKPDKSSRTYVSESSNNTHILSVSICHLWV